jgi:hypothetical protein
MTNALRDRLDSDAALTRSTNAVKGMIGLFYRLQVVFHPLTYLDLRRLSRRSPHAGDARSTLSEFLKLRCADAHGSEKALRPVPILVFRPTEKPKVVSSFTSPTALVDGFGTYLRAAWATLWHV